jgi:hypothetical protein
MYPAQLSRSSQLGRSVNVIGDPMAGPHHWDKASAPEFGGAPASLAEGAAVNDFAGH